MLRTGKRRVSGGRVEVWRAAFAEVRRYRRKLCLLGLVVVAFVAFANLPWWPAYERGFLTGAFVVAAAWMAVWVLWVLSGLAFRLNGTWAEDATLDSMRKSARVHDVVPSLKFGKHDIDAVAITPAAVYAVETKWRSREPGTGELASACHAAARDGRTLRNSLSDRGLPGELVRPVLVVCGPGARELETQDVQTALGTVTVVSGVRFDAWVEAIPNGPIGPDYAATLAAELHALAVSRDAYNVEAGPLLRYLGRVR